jgi:hypothetical protein
MKPEAKASTRYDPPASACPRLMDARNGIPAQV